MAVIRVLHVGLGPIGAAVVRQVAVRKGLKIVGAVDIDPAKVGHDLGEVTGTGRKLGVKVMEDLRKAIKASKPDVAVLCTSSSLKSVVPQFEQVLKLKVPIVSTTEELAFPTSGNNRWARAIHKAAIKGKAAVLGTGVNPGFTMDALPLALTAVCERVDAIEVDRVQDARIRRLPFQQKIGAGLTKAQFQAKVDNASVRHVGLAESISMIAHGLGWKIDRITDEIQPKIAAEGVASEFLAVDPGFVCGLVQDGTGYRDGKPVIRYFVSFAHDDMKLKNDLMKLLRVLRNDLSRYRMTFADVMPVAGVDKGTLEGRFDDFSEGSVVGKTGTLGQTDGKKQGSSR